MQLEIFRALDERIGAAIGVPEMSNKYSAVQA